MQMLPSVINTPECDYVLSLPWKWQPSSHSWTVSNIPTYTSEKLKTIFNGWRIGWDANTAGCKQGILNVNVGDRQFRRVGIIKEIPTIEEVAVENS